ncbi:PIN domain-containing protein [Thiocapsa rosea]|uniref:PIN domain-containing protein n=1 Tax=Thiocapsa rosea TaxID=69360 RepID=UPI002482913F|nr:PIN domain-containing protein [Thiocapsa rosea]
MHLPVFVGIQQNRIPFDFTNAMQRLGEHARYVRIGGIGGIGGAGRNALDFHLAFYLGELVQRDPGRVFRVVSKDGGFDP